MTEVTTNQSAGLHGVWQRSRLQGKFLLIAIPLILLTTVSLFFYIHTTTTTNQLEELETRIDQVAEIEAVSLSGLVWSFNQPQIQLFMSAIVNDPDIIGARVEDDNGNILGVIGEQDVDQLNTFEAKRGIFHEGTGGAEPRLIGELTLNYSTDRQQIAAGQRFWNTLIMLSIMTASVIASALIALQFAVRSPLNRFLQRIRADQIEHLNQPDAGDITQKGDEVGTVVSAYNVLQTQHKAYEQELTDIKDDLEIRVEERTQDLRKARDRAQSAFENLQSTQAKLVQSEKMASLGQLTAGIAHEIKNPLNFVNNFASLSGDLMQELVDALKDPINKLPETEKEDVEEIVDTLKANLGRINEHGQRADSIVKNMLLHARHDESTLSEANINAVVEEAIGLVYHAARAEKQGFNITIEKDFDETLSPVACYSQDIMRVFINVLSNGMYAANERHSDPTAEVQAKIWVKTSQDENSVHVDITDNGHGIPQDKLEHIFTPFYTTKPAGEGTGLGLSLSFDIVETQHNGSLLVDSKPNEFTRFSIMLPKTAAPTDPDD